nr:hypothetical protein BgiMline_021263 [Biomphalaria glabrata]
MVDHVVDNGGIHAGQWWTMWWTMVEYMPDIGGLRGYVVDNVVDNGGIHAGQWWTMWWTMVEYMPDIRGLRGGQCGGQL